MPTAKTQKSEATFRQVAVELIDDPLKPTRSTMEEAQLAELIDSIRELGMVQPVVLQQQPGGRYRVCAGHRRMVAARALDLKTVPAMVVPITSSSAAAIQCVENAVREAVNPAEEASWLQFLYVEHCGSDTVRLCELVKRSRDYVEARLVLLAGDPEVLRAVQEKRVSLAGARELNRITDPTYRAVYLEAARRGGATVSTIQRWRMEWEQLVRATQGTVISAVNNGPAPPAPAPHVGNKCFICEDEDEPWDMELMFVHRRCRKIILDRFLDSLGASTRRDRQGGPDGASA